jgi:hypothetical protein
VEAKESGRKCTSGCKVGVRGGNESMRRRGRIRRKEKEERKRIRRRRKGKGKRK